MTASISFSSGFNAGSMKRLRYRFSNSARSSLIAGMPLRTSGSVIPAPQSAPMEQNAAANAKVPDSLIIPEPVKAPAVRFQAGLETEYDDRALPDFSHHKRHSDRERRCQVPQPRHRTRGWMP